MSRALPAVLLLAACAGPSAGLGGGLGGGRLGCAGEVRLANASGQVIEQAYLGGPGAWGGDLLAPGTLPPGATASFRAPPGPGRQAVRVVFDTGRAAELPGLDLCETPEITVGPGRLTATARGRP